MNLQFDAQRIKALRSRLGITQREFASRLSVSQPAVALWELGLHKPSGAQILENLLRLENDDLPELEEVKSAN